MIRPSCRSLSVFLLLACLFSARAEVKLIVPPGYLPGVPFLARVEVRDTSGARNRDLWDAEATLSSDNAGVTLSTNRVALKNGLGTVLLTISGSANFNLRAQVGVEQASRAAANRSGQAVTTVSGTLAGASSTWSGVVNVTGTVTVPVGHTLTIDPGTIVRVNGVASGTAGINIVVNGTIRSLGTEAAPVTITCSDANLNWGQIRHESAQASTYQYTFISKATRTGGEGHTGTGPAIRATNSTIDFEGSVVSDMTAAGATIGKVMMATGSSLTFRDSVWARARMGPEIASTGMLMTNCWVTEMIGPDDADGIYLHDAGGQPLTLSGCVFAGGNDDAVDTLDSNVLIENCILRDWPNSNEDAKGVSAFHGEVTLRRCLIANCYVGLSAKSSGPLAVLRIDHCTVNGITQGVSAATKSNASAGNINIYMTNSIVRSVDSLHSDFGPEKFVSVTYTDSSQPWPGAGNITNDPLFVNANAGDYHLQPGSPAIDAGDPASAFDPDGSRTDMGFYRGQSTGSFFVAITEPASGAIYKAPTNLTVSAISSSSTGTVVRVEFYENASKIGEDASSPYSITWPNVAVGSHTILAVATQAGGLMTTSGPVSFSVTATEGPSTNVFITRGDVWKYLDNGSDQGVAWRALNFNDSLWVSNIAQFGYGDNDEQTQLVFGPNANDKYVTYYFRKVFVVDDAARIEALTMELLRDDGAVIYLNNQEAFRTNMPAGPIGYRTYATNAVEYGWETGTLNKNLLVTGMNIIAVEIHQGSPNSGDISFDMSLSGVLAAPTNARPIVSVTSPQNNDQFVANSNIGLTASAQDIDGSVTNVSFYANGANIGSDASGPFSIAWNNVASGEYDLVAVASDNWGLAATSSVVHVTVSADVGAPMIASQIPAPGTVTNLTEITVNFSKGVVGVSAGDLLVNGAPAKSVSGSGTSYTFSINPPPPGALNITWASGHGITDTFVPPHAFESSAVGSTWQYMATDTIAPTVEIISPAARAGVTQLSTITVTFKEAVSGVHASDLLINSIPAVSVSGAGAGPYTFTFPQPTPGTVLVNWAGGHGIADLASNPFGGGNWSYLLDPNQIPVVINEIMYHPSSENPLEEYIELHNYGPSAVSVAGWKFTSGINFTFPNVSIPSGGYLVVAANVAAFNAKYSGVANVVGGWTGMLSNSREDLDLDDPSGDRIDSVRYADEGDWAIRQRGNNDRGYRGWTWFAGHDGLGKSAELINPRMSNNNGQNWADSIEDQGTPGRVNSVFANHVAPIIENISHFPLVPKSTNSVLITASLTGDAGLNVTATLNYRLDALNPGNFIPLAMKDDGTGGDAVSGDGVFSAIVPPQTNNAIVEFYISASDSDGISRNWPAPAIAALDNAGPTGQVVNALYQVDDAEYAGSRPFYKAILTARENRELQEIQNNVSGSANSDATMNATFISIDGAGSQLRYLAGIRNRGHGSRAAKPNNFRIGFRSDETWKGQTALNLNAQLSWMQVFGAALNLRSGIPGAYSRGVELRINNVNLFATGPLDRTFGLYAANEPIDADWAERHFPNDSEGNIYRAIRDLFPPDFDYRTQAAYPTVFGPENKNSYTNTWFKESNASEDDWTDLIAMLRVLGVNGTDSFEDENISRVINVSEWLRHLAVMNLLGSSETGLNTGHNDDYFLYRGVEDPRFVVLYYDLDQILGFGGSYPANSTIFSATAPNGAGQAIGRLLLDPAYQPIYYEHLRNLLDTVFSDSQFDALVEQTLGDWVPDTQRQAIKSWMTTRRNYVRSQLPPPAFVGPLRATISGGPRSPTPRTTASFTVGGEGLTHYRYLLNGALSAEFPIGTPISLNNVPNGTNTIVVIGKSSAGTYQSTLGAEQIKWVVNTSMPAVRLNEIVASRSGQLRDAIELYNEGGSTVTLTGMGITDNASNPYKFSFGARSLASGAYLVIDANELGFAFDASGESVYLFNSPANGGALLDSVAFGAQLTDLSIGRYGDAGNWRLSQVTLDAANVEQPVGDPTQTKINEWLAFGLSPYPDDFVELYNPGTLPVNVGGWFLTDEPIGDATRSQIAPYSFIGAKSYLAFTSGNGNQADEINFGLAEEQGQVALLNAQKKIIDSVVYGPQRAGISNGRCADGSLSIRTLVSPTPGGPNECPFVAPAPTSVTLIPFDHVWRYDASGSNLGTAWKDTNYVDGSWSSGPGVLGNENAALAEPIRTTIPLGARTFYFRTTFNFDPAITPTSLQITHLIDDGAAFYLNGQEVTPRFNLADNATYQTPASPVVGDATLNVMSVPLGMIRPGLNYLAVEVHQNDPGSTDIVLGLKLDALIVTNSAVAAGVVINEVLADNVTFFETDESHPDWVELYNPSDNNVTLAGMSLTDTLALRTRWVFPSGAFISAKSFYKIRCDGDLPSSDTNTGFGLKANGGVVYLFSSLADGSGLVSSLNYGLQAADWSIGRVPDGSTNWVLTIPTIGIANSPATLGNPAALRINEWMAEPASGSDWFEVFNPNAEPVDFSRFWLSDSVTSRQKHQIAALSFIGTGAHAFRRFDADDNVSAGSDHVAFKLEGGGEALAISTRAGALIHGFSFGPQTLNVSQGRLPDGSDTLVRFVGSPSPGSANFVTLTNVFINELLSHSDPPLMDAVELYNPTGDAVEIGSWFLSDSAINARKYQIPPNTTIPANGYLVLYEDAFNGDLAADPFSFSSANGDEVYLSQTGVAGALTGYRATASFGPGENGVSFGRFQTSQGYHFVVMESRTFGRDNPANTNEFKLGTGRVNSYAKVGPVVISEIMYHPFGTNDALEFIELHNIASTNAPLYDVAHPANPWRLRKGADFDFATGASIPGNGYLVVVNFNPQTDPVSVGIFQQAYGPGVTLAGPFSGSLDNAGESVELQKPDAPEENGDVPYIVVDRIDYDDVAPWPSSADGTGPSLQRRNDTQYGNDPINWAAESATPGRGRPTGDTDGDGMPDTWEQTNGTNPAVADANGDVDNDGLTNLREFQLGTKGNDASDPVRIRTATVAPGGVTLQFWAGAGRSYTVMVADTDPKGTWRVLREIPASASTTLVEITDAPNPIQVRFYQIVASN